MVDVPRLGTRSIRSSVAGAIDVVYNQIRKRVQPSTERWFRNGYGDLPRYYQACDDALGAWEVDGLEHLLAPPVALSWQE